MTNSKGTIDFSNVEWKGVTAALLSDLATALLAGVTEWAKAQQAQRSALDAAREAAPVMDDSDTAALDAATLLGVPLDAAPDQIRAALRAKLATSRVHPDQGGDVEAAKRLISAKNLLIDRARAREVQP